MRGWRGTRLLLGALAGALLVGLCAPPVEAVQLVGGDAAHRAAVQDLLAEQPALVEYIEAVFPGFQVRVNYGGAAWPGYFYVSMDRWGTAFTDMVAHELGHEVQLAADAPGGHEAIGDDWLALLTARGWGPATWVWPTVIPPYGWRNPWECFAENVKRAYFSPCYTLGTTPNSELLWLSRAEMTEFLRAHGCEVGRPPKGPAGEAMLYTCIAQSAGSQEVRD